MSLPDGTIYRQLNLFFHEKDLLLVNPETAISSGAQISELEQKMIRLLKNIKDENRKLGEIARNRIAQHNA